MRRLKFDNETLKSVATLVRYHDYRMPVRGEAVRRRRALRLSKKANAFSAKGVSLRSAPRSSAYGVTIRRSLRAKCFSDVHAAGKTISFSSAACGRRTRKGQAASVWQLSCLRLRANSARLFYRYSSRLNQVTMLPPA